MDFLPAIAAVALPATLLLLLTLLAMRLRQRGKPARPGMARQALDTLAAWPPEATRVLSIDERAAYDLLRRAMPGFLVLAQVPLARFLRVPSRHPHADWLQRVAALNADLVLCDAGSKVLAVIDIRAPQEGERSKRRHERLARVLQAARIPVFTWREGQLPHIVEVRHALSALMGAAAGGSRPVASAHGRPAPLIPVAESAELSDALTDALTDAMTEGDRLALQAVLDNTALEPVPSGFYDGTEVAAVAVAGRR